jgi:hypothetical protein
VCGGLEFFAGGKPLRESGVTTGSPAPQMSDSTARRLVGFVLDARLTAIGYRYQYRCPNMKQQRGGHRRADLDLVGAKCERCEVGNRRLAISGRLDAGRNGSQSPRVVAIGVPAQIRIRTPRTPHLASFRDEGAKGQASAPGDFSDRLSDGPLTRPASRAFDGDCTMASCQAKTPKLGPSL